MKFNIMRIMNAIAMAMAIAEKMTGKTGKEKLTVVLDSTPEIIEALEMGIGRDILSDPHVIEAEKQAIAGIKAFHNAIDAAKLAKGTNLPN